MLKLTLLLMFKAQQTTSRISQYHDHNIIDYCDAWRGEKKEIANIILKRCQCISKGEARTSTK